VIVDAGGAICASASRGYDLIVPAPNRVEVDPEAVWRGFTTTAAVLVARGRRLGLSLSAMAVSSSVDESVFIDANGQPIGRVIMAPDTRSSAAFSDWLGRVGVERCWAVTGLPAYPPYAIARLLWLREHHPRLFMRVRRALDWSAFIASRLGLPATTDPSIAARTMAWDVSAGAWSSELLGLAEMSQSLFPSVVPAGSAIGVIADDAARKSGLPRGLSFVVGGMDQWLAAIGSGVVDPGQAAVGTGTWEALSAPLAAFPAFGEPLRRSGISVGPFVPGDRYAALATQSGGLVVRWFGEVFAPGRPIGSLLRSAPDRPTGLLVQPHLEGSLSPWMDPDSRMAIAGLALTTGRNELLRGVLEGITFELRENLSRIEASGVPLRELRASGGGARSRRWLQLKADVLGRPVATVGNTATAAYGAALLAGAGVGVFGPVAATARQFVRVERVYEPRPSFSRAYDEIFERYRQLYPALRSLTPPPPPAG